MAAPLVKAAIAMPGGRGFIKAIVLVLFALLLVPVLVIVAVIVPADQNQRATQCPDLVGGPGDPPGVATGALGGISGTGITRADLDTVRAGRASHVTTGAYVTTAYGPPWGGIQGPGISTSAGLRLNGGAPKKYFVAVDPSLISYGSWVYIWPNPFKWRGAFLAADTGGAIVNRRIDFYDWRGRETQNGWGRVTATVSDKPMATGTLPAGDGPLMVDVAAPAATTPNTTTPDSAATDPSCADTGVVIGGSGAGQAAVKLAVKYIGRSARTSSFTGFQPPTVQDAWCAWFLTNLWKKAGVPIPVNLYSGYPYQWAQAAHKNLIIKADGQPAKTLRLSVGDALMYGSGVGSSKHVNMVKAVNPDGTIEVIGGNQGPDPGHVTTHGPCRLRNAGNYVWSTCDYRPIYAIVAPAAADTKGDTL